MPFEHILRNRQGGELTAEERKILDASVSELRTFPAGTTLIHHGIPVDVSTMLVKGIMTRHLHDHEGRRHMVAVHFPGDFVDLHAFVLRSLDHDVGALTDVTVAIVPHERLENITENFAHLTRRLWFLTLIDAAVHRQWVFRLAGLNAISRVAHFLCETNARLMATGQSDGHRFALPMTQTEIGEVCGLTGIHVNRVMRDLRDLKLCTVRSAWVEIHDVPGLVNKGEFDSHYLYLTERYAQRALGTVREDL